MQVSRALFNSNFKRCSCHGLMGTRVQSPAVEESLLSGLVLREVRVLLGSQRVQVSEPDSGRGEWGVAIEL